MVNSELKIISFMTSSLDHKNFDLFAANLAHDLWLNFRQLSDFWLAPVFFIAYLKPENCNLKQVATS